MMINGTKLRDAQETLAKALQELQNEVQKTVDDTPALDGVTMKKSKSGFSYGTVSFSALSESMVLSPSYYDPFTQSVAVQSKLCVPGISLEQFMDRLARMIKDKSITSMGATIQLNPNTLTTLESIQAQLL